jgi:hypothetical protein
MSITRFSQRLFSTRVVFRRLGYRLVALGLVLIGIVSVRYYTESHEDRFAFIVEIPPPLETESGQRDLSQYDYGGRIGACSDYGDNNRPGANCVRMIEQARTFIEEHFKGQRRGYLIIDSATADSFSTEYYFVEPSYPGGRWEIRVSFGQPGPYTRFRRNVNTEYYTEAFRRRIPKGSFEVTPGANALVLRARGVYERLL